MRKVCNFVEPTANGNGVKNTQTHATFSGFPTTKKRTFPALEVVELGFLVGKTDFPICQKNRNFTNFSHSFFVKKMLCFCIFY